jgi:TusA-related sulfurtransferase
MNMIQQGAPGMACDAELDAVGLACPMPLLKAKLELNRLASGQVLKVTATDPGSQRDFRSFANLAGHTLLHEDANDGLYRYWLRKA